MLTLLSALKQPQGQYTPHSRAGVLIGSRTLSEWEDIPRCDLRVCGGEFTESDWDFLWAAPLKRSLVF